MSSGYFSKQVRSWSKAAALAIALATPIATAATAQTDAPSEQQVSEGEAVQTVFAELSDQEQAALTDGQVTVTAKRAGDEGQFVARVLVDAPTETAWEVLTDYDNFKDFLPNVKDSALLEEAGNRKVFQQLNVVSVVPGVLDIESRVQIASVESFPQQVDFELVGGDLALLEGQWALVPVVSEDEDSADKVLITHQVNIDPGESSPRGLFFSTYRLVLEDSLAAAKTETEARVASQAEES
ncbi:MAG: SRPBCC family protein [Cyanobacteria bacterium J06560_2]